MLYANEENKSKTQLKVNTAGEFPIAPDRPGSFLIRQNGSHDTFK